ncbi:hypothetical protein [Aliiroseovarius sp. PrR006]|uniref:hypothetical protein n=1 Tax=Aliiroseovarius sp. PrR006 TaxID=2706883 RepID=UPI0013D39D7C|nr:hypothetical protein [Aliiroseovarius sp. PrR006]NDW54287.1 hypothetical protein [Aliiroseovarius sp. PrR006]
MRRWVGPMFVMVSVFVASLLLSGGVAEAHGTHAPSETAITKQSDTVYFAADNQGHCFGGAFCTGPAIVQHNSLPAGAIAHRERYALPGETLGLPVISGFDPPPPRLLN